VKVERSALKHLEYEPQLETRSPLEESSPQFPQTDPAMLMRPAHGIADLRDGFADFTPLVAA
jgi:hypothetical protein